LIVDKNKTSVVLFADILRFPELLRVLRREGIELPVYTGITHAAELKDNSAVILLSPGIENKHEGLEFIREFEEAYGYSPGAREAYAYDGMNLILESIYKAGTDPEAIRVTLAEITHPEGVTGKIRFDEYGNRVMYPGTLTPYCIGWGF
jgi:ABC-type branched-subunit amino acid transport system substrate-binding protein